MSTRKRSAVTTMAVSGIALMGVLLAGCASSPFGLSGANDLPSTSVSREANIRHTDLCIYNDSSRRVRITWDGDNAPIDLPIRTGGFCKMGYVSGGKDVTGTLDYETAPNSNTWTRWVFTATNPWMGAPESTVYFRTPQGDRGICDVFGVLEARTMQDGSMRAEVKRYGDWSYAKELQLTISEGDGTVSGVMLDDCVYR